MNPPFVIATKIKNYHTKISASSVQYRIASSAGQRLTMVESSSSPLRSESMASAASSSNASTTSSSSTTKPITALPTDEALQILLSPDGYYQYLSIPKPTPDTMGLKYQAAMAAGGAPTTETMAASSDAALIDLDQIKKNYRRLSLKHHPDRRTGDAECFRMLNRAKVVLSNAKLRREYDLVGLDLEDDEEHDHDDRGDGVPGGNGSPKKENDDEGSSSGEAHHEDHGKDGNSSKTETVMGHLASATLAAVLQVVVRTGLMGFVSSVISRYTILVRACV